MIPTQLASTFDNEGNRVKCITSSRNEKSNSTMTVSNSYSCIDKPK